MDEHAAPPAEKEAPHADAAAASPLLGVHEEASIPEASFTPAAPLPPPNAALPEAPHPDGSVGVTVPEASLPRSSDPEVTVSEAAIPEPSLQERAVPDSIADAVLQVPVPGDAAVSLRDVDAGSPDATLPQSAAPEGEDAGPAIAPTDASSPAARPKRPAASEAELAALRKRAKDAWDAIVAAHASGDTVLGTVVSSVKGGMLVDISGIRGFLPASQVRPAPGQTLDDLVKTVVPLKVLDLDAPRRRAVVSARRAAEQQRREQRAVLIRSLAPGQRREAVVVRLTDFGAFVDLGGVDGLIPMSELALERVEKAGDAVNVGEKLEVEVLRVDEGGKKISLSRKNVLPDPWRDHAALLRPGNVIEGKVVAKEPRLTIELAPGLVGIMRESDADPADYAIGETVEVAVRTADRRARRIVLTTPYAGNASLSSGGSGFAPLGQELLQKRRE